MIMLSICFFGLFAGLFARHMRNKDGIKYTHMGEFQGYI